MQLGLIYTIGVLLNIASIIVWPYRQAMDEKYGHLYNVDYLIFFAIISSWIFASCFIIDLIYSLICLLIKTFKK